MAQLRKGFTNTDFLCDDIMSSLTEYSDDVAVRTRKAVDIVTREVSDEIKKHLSFNSRTGNYIKSFRTKTLFEDKRNKRNTWYVKEPHYRLTHLLEFGHINRNGTRTRAFPHVQYGEEIAERRLPELIEKVLQGEDI
jgi:hypothetical protein